MGQGNTEQRLLTELVCRAEEADGHPVSAAEAEARAIASGGNFSHRIMVRALNLPGSDQALSDVRQVLQSGRFLNAGLALLSAFLGIAAAGAALQQASTVSLPLVLLTLVGVNLISMLIWILLQIFGGQGGMLLRTAWTWISRHLGNSAAVSESKFGYRAAAVLELTTGRGSRWRISAISHLAWLCYTTAGLGALTVLLTVSTYSLSWQTTLLSPEALYLWAEKMSVVPRLFGASGPDVLPVSGVLDAGDRRGWALWILLAVFSYGLLPRLVAWLVCALMTQKAQARWGSDTSRPGFARLRERLMPDLGQVRLIDKDCGRQVPHEVLRLQAAQELPTSRLHAVFLEWDAVPDDAPFTFLETIDDAVSRDAALARLRSELVSGLVVIVCGTTTPDRGIERMVFELTRAISASCWLALGDLDALRGRGPRAYHDRLAEWSSLAERSRAHGGLMQWHETAPYLRPIEDQAVA